MYVAERTPRAGAASAATHDTVQLREAKYNLANGQLTIAADTVAVLAATVIDTGQKIGTLTSYIAAVVVLRR